jgi:hypothetical protein
MNDNQYGMKDYYNFFVENNPFVKISRKEYNKIISEFNSNLAPYIIEEKSLQLPYRLGKIEILKTKRKAFLDKKGNLRNNIPINWKATNELWERDPSLKEKKVLIRHNNAHSNDYVFKIYYVKKSAIFKNKSIYFFKPVRDFSRGLAYRILDYSKSKYDAYIKSNYHV